MTKPLTPEAAPTPDALIDALLAAHETVCELSQPPGCSPQEAKEAGDALRSARSAILRAISTREAMVEALAPFARFNVPDDMRRKGYRGVVYGTHQSGGPTELTVDDFDRARAALASSPPAEGARAASRPTLIPPEKQCGALTSEGYVCSLPRGHDGWHAHSFARPVPTPDKETP